MEVHNGGTVVSVPVQVVNAMQLFHTPRQWTKTQTSCNTIRMG
jgi:hypothetical protein